MKNQRFQSLGRYILFKCLAASFCLLLLCSCTSTVYDMRQLDQPVVLNNNPFLISRTVTSPKLVNVDTYSATVQNTVSGANDTTTTSTVNTAQLNAFLKIGGEPNYFIGNVTIDTEGQWANLLFLLFGTHAEIDATGEVAQIQAPLMRPPVGPSGQPTNQPALSSAVPK